MSDAGPGDRSEFERLAQQYWNAWGDALRHSGIQAPQQAQAAPWWTPPAPGPEAAVGGEAGAQQPAGDWFSLMQQVAAQFAGRQSSAAEIGKAWREALGAAGGDPFGGMFRNLGGQGLHGLDGWLEQVQPWLLSLQQQGERWGQMPPLGLTREHQQRWQQLGQALQEYRHCAAEYQSLMTKAGQHAFDLFERKLEEHAEPGRQLHTARALFDLWIDAAEDAYAVSALSPEFRHAYGALANAQMRLRAGLQREVEHLSLLFGMPTRTEVDAAHRKIVELERTLRKLRDAVSEIAAGAASPSAKPSRSAAGASAGTAAGAGKAVESAPARPRSKPAASPARTRAKTAGTAAEAPRAATGKHAASTKGRASAASVANRKPAKGRRA